MFYANASLVRDRINVLVGRSEPMPQAVVLDIGANGTLDITSADTLTDLALTLKRAGIDFALAEVRTPVREVGRRTGLLDALPDPEALEREDLADT